MTLKERWATDYKEESIGEVTSLSAFLAKRVKHLVGQHDQASHGKGGRQERLKALAGDVDLGEHLPAGLDALDFLHDAYETSTDRYTTEITNITKKDGMLVYSEIRDSGGNEIGGMARIFNKEKVTHVSMWLSEDKQNSGIGKELYQQQESAYIAAGIKEISLQANSTIGGYAWASMGFDFEDPLQAMQFGESFSIQYKKAYGSYPPVFPETAGDIASYRGPDDRAIGKEFMLGSNWNARKVLNVAVKDKG